MTIKRPLFSYSPGKWVRVGLLCLTDAFWSSFCFAGSVAFIRWLNPENFYNPQIYFQVLPFVAVFILINACFRIYHGRALSPGFCINRIEEIRRLSFSIFVTYLILFTILLYARKEEYYPRTGMLLGMVLTMTTLPVVRFMVRLVMKKLNIGMINVFIAGAGESGIYVAHELTSSCYYGFKIAGFLDDDPMLAGGAVAGYPVLGTLAMARTLSRRHQVEYVINCLPAEVYARTFRVYSKIFRHIMFVVNNDILPVWQAYPVSVGFYCGFEIRNRMMEVSARLFKYCVESILSLFVIIFLLPLFGVLALLVKLSSPGPVFYSARRLGKGGRKISVLKFRTMYCNADVQLEKMLAENPVLKREWQEKFKLKNDPRITPIGKFLRKTSLDELPQFWNIITGEMSLIGPRPIVEEEVHYYGSNYEFLKSVRPGITGLWQVSGRSDTDYRDRVSLDLYYITNWSVWLDYFIFFKTIFVVLLGRGAR